MIKRTCIFLACSLMACSAYARDISVAAVVNDEVISTQDLDDRIRFVVATTGLTDSAEVRDRIRQQILRTLIDERLQLQEAARSGVSVSEEEITQAIASIEKQHGKPPGSFGAHLAKNNLSKDSFSNQLRAQISWSKLVYKKFRPRVRISQDEVKQQQTKSTIGKGAEFQIATILLPVDQPSREGNVKKLADKLVAELRKGADFVAVAAQVSATPPKDEESSKFWVKAAEMDGKVAAIVRKLSAGKISDPVRTLAGYQIIKLYAVKAGKDEKLQDDSAYANTEVAVKWIHMSLKPDAKNDEVDTLMTIAKEVQKHPGTCLDEGVAGFKDTDIADIKVTFKHAKLANLSPELRKLIGALKVGDVSEPFATPTGLQLLQLCERVDLPAEFAENEKTKDKIFQQKMELEAEKYLRNLRREAFIDIRE